MKISREIREAIKEHVGHDMSDYMIVMSKLRHLVKTLGIDEMIDYDVAIALIKSIEIKPHYP